MGHTGRLIYVYISVLLIVVKGVVCKPSKTSGWFVFFFVNGTESCVKEG